MKYIALFLALVASSFAQSTGSNVVNIIPVVASTTITSSQTFTSASLQNIGQTNHVGILNVTASSGSNIATCAIEGSVDGTNWQAIGNSVNFGITAGVIQQFRFYGYGSYPNIRVNVAFLLNSSPSVTFSINYIGNSIPSNVLVDMSGGAANMRVLWNPGLTGGGVITSLLVPSATQRFNLYAISLFSDATGTNITLQCGVNTAAYIGNLGVTRTIIWPSSLRPYISCSPGETFSYTLAGTPVVSMSLSYRLE